MVHKLKDFGSYLVASISKSLFFRLAYFHNRGKWPNLKCPHDLSELWIAKVLRGDNMRNYSWADKYLVRNHIVEIGLGELLVPLIGMYTDADDIDFESLPNRFAIKMNYGAGMNIIVPDKKLLNITEAKETLNKWMNSSKYYSNAECHYNIMKRRIVIEEFIDDGNEGFPRDYKFMCINGKVHCILAVTDRNTGHGVYLPYSRDWMPLRDYFKGDTSNIQVIKAPENLKELISVSEKIAEGTDLLRVDLYSDGTKIWFGEITLTPSGCIFHRWSQKALDTMGKIARNQIVDAKSK